MYKEITEEEFLNEVNNIWIPKLYAIFGKARDDIWRAIHKNLKKPNFEIITSMRKWGTWSSKRNIIQINQKLLRHYPWEAVRHVVRHEIAHMIVSEIWKLDGEVAPHGDAFKKACKILNIPSTASDSPSYLMEFGVTNEAVVRKVKKLMALSSSSNDNESTSAMAKAHRLMKKHNIKDVEDTVDDIYVARPIGVVGKNVPGYLRDICHILEEFYFVKHISSYHYKGGKSLRHIQIFGKPENVDLAEYVFHFLYNQGMLHWEEFKKECKENGENIRGNYSKNSYLESFYRGYNYKLKAESKKDEHIESEEYESMTAVLNIAENKLDERYRKHYPNIRTCYRAETYMSGGNGFSKGSSLKFKQGVNGSSRGGRISG